MAGATLCIVGLGYVGLPLAHAFAETGHRVVGFDISEKRISTLKEGKDWTGELTTEQLATGKIDYTTDPSMIKDCDVIILALPTPVDEKNDPDLTPVIEASKTVGKYLKKGAIVVYESTVYPGVTEDICGPILEKESGMICGKDFTLGYSPERINPGDKEHTVRKIKKIVAGQDPKTTDTLVALYGSIITAGIHRAESIKVAEMAKAIENAQRDLNIAFVNEIALLCHKLGIKTKNVLAAAGTKWNFLPFKPGLVGGHCIGVDPYYLMEVAKMHDMETHVITAGRAINDGMSRHVAQDVASKLGKPDGKKILVLGLTFKENIPDTRNSKSEDVIKHLIKLGFAVEAHDPNVAPEEMKRHGHTLGSLDKGPYDAMLLLVPHKEYMAVGTEGLMKAVKPGGVIYDVKSILDEQIISESGRTYLCL